MRNRYIRFPWKYAYIYVSVSIPKVDLNHLHIIGLSDSITGEIRYHYKQIKLHSFWLAFGKKHVFRPTATAELEISQFLVFAGLMVGTKWSERALVWYSYA